MTYQAITDVEGIEVGHAHRDDALTGCTVVMCKQGAAVGVDVRGAAPGTRETDLCRPGSLVTRAHAVLLTGGSAFGLEAASGVMRWLSERNIGFDAGTARVPIVPGAVIYDLGMVEQAWPDAALGYAACGAAGSGSVVQGSVGAGRGATVGKLYGLPGAVMSGVGTASIAAGPFTVGAIFAVNAFGDVLDPASGRIVAGARDPDTGRFADTAAVLARGVPGQGSAGANTTIGVVATDADLDSMQINHLARVAHDGLARSVRPVHTMFDGDTVFGLATGTARAAGTNDLVVLASAAVSVVERSVLNAVRHASSLAGVPSIAG